MAKLGRNDPCHCGSGSKFKRCCGSLTPGFDDRIRAALLRSLEDDRDARQSAVDDLSRLRSTFQATAEERNSADTALIQALQRVGDHRAALMILDELPPPNARLDQAIRFYWRGLSLERIGRYAEAILAYEEAIPTLKEELPDQYPLYLLELGKVYRGAERNDDALKAWKESVNILEQRGNDREHLARARSNIGMLLLHSNDPGDRASGEQMLFETSNEKALVGDLEGLTNNYSALSLYYQRIEKWERAIAFARRDLKLTRLIGDSHQLCATLGNMAIIYIDMLQLTAARRCLAEAEAIGRKLDHPHTLRMVEVNHAALEGTARQAASMKMTIGPGARCRCMSGKPFNECCGRADFEPDTPLIGPTEAPGSAKTIFHNTIAPGQTQLDRVLASDTTDRFAWTNITPHDGWLEISELPDVANYHLSAARNLAESSKGEDPFRFDEALASCILSVCAAEAFINTVCFFVVDTAKRFSPHPDSMLGRAFAYIGDAMAYQRGTELSLKWTNLGELLAGPAWITDSDWKAFTTLISIRNELVHFKAADFEQVSPAPKHPHDILRRLPPGIALRDIPHSWPAKLLTTSFARWTVSTVETVIESLKAGYARTNPSQGGEETATAPIT